LSNHLDGIRSCENLIEISALTSKLSLNKWMGHHLVLAVDAKPMHDVMVYRLVGPSGGPCRFLCFTALQRSERVCDG